MKKICAPFCLLAFLVFFVQAPRQSIEAQTTRPTGDPKTGIATDLSNETTYEYGAAAVAQTAATTTAATAITATSATLNGTVNPNGVATTAWFNWGTSSRLFGTSATPTQAVGAGTANVAVSANISGLSPGTTYYYQIRAGVDRKRVSLGAILSFTTPSTRSVTSVSAASYTGAALAPESIATAFGSGLATTTEKARTVPLPTTLAGTTVKIKDSAGREQLAPLFFVAPNQVNYLVPTGLTAGAASIVVTSGNGQASVGAIQLAALAPGLFSANANGQGVTAATILRVKAGGAQSYEPAFRLDQATSKYVAVPLDLGPTGDQLFLVAFGTGFRGRSSLSATSARIGGVDARVSFAGPQGGLVGVDQLNLAIPRSLLGRGEVQVQLVVDGKAANVVTLHIK